MSAGKLALVAGEGILPFEILKSLRASGKTLPDVYLLSSDPCDEERYRAEGVFVQKILNPLAVAMILVKMRFRGIRQLIMAGRVPKKAIYSADQMDDGAREVLARTENHSDHSLLAGIVRYIENFGIRVMSYEQIIPDMFASEGHIAGPVPGESDMQDCAYGLNVLKILLPLSFGQSLIVSNQSVVAVEAMEGTDQMIRRSAVFHAGGVVIKGIRADQDRRYDLPVVGPMTLQTMAEAGIRSLFIQAGSVLILDKERFIQDAQRLGISVTGVAACQFS